MAVAAHLASEKTDEQKAITEMVRQFVDEQILPNAEHYDHEDSFPEPIVEQMKELGLFGVTIPEEYGGMGLDLTTYAMIVEELSRGWISISGDRQHPLHRLLPADEVRHRRAEAEVPAADGHRRDPRRLLAVRARARLRRAGDQDVAPRSGDDGDYEINGQKMWVTNGLLSALVFVLVKTDPDADPRHKGMTCFIAEKEPGASENTGAYAGLNVPPKIKKMGYKGVESTELVFDGYRCPAENILGGEEAGPEQGLRADDGRARGRARQRRRARRRASPSARSSWRCATRRSARRSASRSPSTRRSSSSSPTWPRRSTPRGC